MIGEDGIELITKVVQTAQALPTTSASIEQAFSILKLFKTDKRNQLCDDSLEALMLINEEFRFNGSINITDQMKKNLVKVKNDLNFRKSSSEKKNQKAIEETIIDTKNSVKENELEIETVKPLSQSINYFEIRNINT